MPDPPDRDDVRQLRDWFRGEGHALTIDDAIAALDSLAAALRKAERERDMLAGSMELQTANYWRAAARADKAEAYLAWQVRQSDKNILKWNEADDELARLRAAFKPIEDWYGAEGDRDLTSMLRDAVADLQTDRAELLRLRAPLDVPERPPLNVDALLRWRDYADAIEHELRRLREENARLGEGQGG